VEAEKFISCEHEIEKAIGEVDRGEAQMACLLKPVRVEQVTEIALGGGVLPQKSTDFYPKLLSGETIYRIEKRVARRSSNLAGSGGRTHFPLFVTLRYTDVIDIRDVTEFVLQFLSFPARRICVN
jgi:hypothetical protein